MYKVRLLFTTPKDFKIPSEIIKWRLGTKYSHVAVATYSGVFKEYDVYEASHGFVHSGSLNNFLLFNDVIKEFSFDLTSEENLKVIGYLKSKTFLRYSVWGAIAATIKPLRNAGLGEDGDAQFICSEYACRAIEQIRDLNYKLYRNSADYVDPKLFERILEESIKGIKIEVF